MTATSLRPYICAFAIALVLPAIIPSASAEIPKVISYQGKVTDSAGAPVADGSYTMRFRIYDDATAGSLEWDSGNRTIAVSDGIFNIMLGESPQPTLDLDFDEDYWLLVTFEGDNQIPRKQLGSVGYAFMASGLVPGITVSGAVPTPPNAIIKAENLASSGIADGILGESHSTLGAGVTGWAYATSGITYGIFGRSDSQNGRGVYGVNTALSGPSFGVYGESASTSGYGVYGYASANTGTTYGGRFVSASPSGRGVYGCTTANTGVTIGVHGRAYSTSGRGVYGYASATTGTTYGGRFESTSPDGRGVYAFTTANTGETIGVYGRTYSTDGTGVFGYASVTTGTTYGGRFVSDSDYGYGVYGHASATAGLGVGVYGSTPSGGWGVYGSATATTGSAQGVLGSSASPSGRGVYGYSTATTGETYGLYGRTNSESGTAVFGYAAGSTGTTYGVYGESGSPSGYGVYYVGGLAGTGTKSCVVRTSHGPTLLYCQESPECWFEDFGEGQLLNGRCHVELDPLFLETVTIDDANPMKVFIELHDEDCNGVAVKKDLSTFEVVERRGGTSNGTFDYRVVAKRTGFESKRLDYCKAAETDSYLYPELREKELREHEEERARMEHDRLRMEQERARMDEQQAWAEREHPRTTEVARLPALPR